MRIPFSRQGRDKVREPSSWHVMWYLMAAVFFTMKIFALLSYLFWTLALFNTIMYIKAKYFPPEGQHDYAGVSCTIKNSTVIFSQVGIIFIFVGLGFLLYGASILIKKA